MQASAQEYEIAKKKSMFEPHTRPSNCIYSKSANVYKVSDSETRDQKIAIHSAFVFPPFTTERSSIVEKRTFIGARPDFGAGPESLSHISNVASFGFSHTRALSLSLSLLDVLGPQMSL